MIVHPQHLSHEDALRHRPVCDEGRQGRWSSSIPIPRRRRRKQRQQAFDRRTPRRAISNRCSRPGACEMLPGKVAARPRRRAPRQCRHLHQPAFRRLHRLARARRPQRQPRQPDHRRPDAAQHRDGRRARAAARAPRPNSRRWSSPPSKARRSASTRSRAFRRSTCCCNEFKAVGQEARPSPRASPARPTPPSPTARPRRAPPPKDKRRQARTGREHAAAADQDRAKADQRRRGRRHRSSWPTGSGSRCRISSASTSRCPTPITAISSPTPSTCCRAATI